MSVFGTTEITVILSVLSAIWSGHDVGPTSQPLCNRCKLQVRRSVVSGLLSYYIADIEWGEFLSALVCVSHSGLTLFGFLAGCNITIGWNELQLGWDTRCVRTCLATKHALGRAH